MRRAPILAALALTLALGGCFGVPTTGPVRQVEAESLPINAGVRVNPQPPAAGATAA